MFSTRKIVLSLIFLLIGLSTYAERKEVDLKTWQFALSRYAELKPAEGWHEVTIPHDWAITTPFDRQNDLQVVRVMQNGEKTATEKTGRSGGLHWFGVGWYKTTLNAEGINEDDRNLGKQYTLVLDGAMSYAHVFVNNVLALYWPYGYNSFSVDLTPFLKNGENELAIRLENKPLSSRWYPGAGLYRDVHLVINDPIYVPTWGQYVTTPQVTDSLARIDLETTVSRASGHTVSLVTDIIYHSDGDWENESSFRLAASSEDVFPNFDSKTPAKQTFYVRQPHLWSPEHPFIYKVRTVAYADGYAYDTVMTTFGIRSISYDSIHGFRLNGETRKFKGVCLHHDLGPLGTAIDKDALRHQLYMLKQMGCDAIRTSHNMPAPQLVELCNEMGLMMMVESFDEWDIPKCDNGYHKYFYGVETHKTLFDPNTSTAQSVNPLMLKWAERDMINMIHHYRNDPCVVMWSIGNEVPDQAYKEGIPVAKWLQDICHREDPTRPVTCGMDQLPTVLDNGFAAAIEIPGLNYRTMRYQEAYDKLPQKLILGSETASTVSSRGVYKFPVEIAPDRIYEDNQCSGYDVEYCSWSGLPDQDFALQDDYPWTIGQFVWTGFDYLGEPSPYDTDAWPSHSSYFGIVDLASLPKDRYWLYRSQWNKDSVTLHALPHWTWPGREMQVTPVFVYTTYPEAELFINGISQGRRTFATREEADTCKTVPVGNFEIASWGSKPQPELLPRYRLMWLDAVYTPGEMKVYAYENIGDTVPADSTIHVTADKPDQLRMELANAEELKMPGAGNLHYFTIYAVDKKGNPCPTADLELEFSVQGHAQFVAAANGDATCLDPLQKPKMHLFAGKCSLLVRIDGPCYITIKSKGVKTFKYGKRRRKW